MSDPRLGRVPRIGTLQDRNRMPMAQRPGRDPQRPYENKDASLASLARHLRHGLDMSKLKTEVDTAVLASLLEHVIAIGFGAQALEKYQQGDEYAFQLETFSDEIGKVQKTEAEKDGKEVEDGRWPRLVE